MHISSMKRMECFFKNYIKSDNIPIRILDVGSYSINGSYRDLLREYKNIEYVGLDILDGPNVDVKVEDIYDWKEIENESFDFIVSGQAFEHIEYPWLTMKQIYLKLKNGGTTCVIAPSTIEEHRYPKDCYRYYGDGLNALVTYAGLRVLETAIGGVPDKNADGLWNDRSNDALIIAAKIEQGEYVQEKKIFKEERRYLPVHDLKLQYEFLHSLYKNDECKFIQQFINEKSYEKIILLGEGYIQDFIFGHLTNDNVIKFRTEGIMANVDGACAIDFTTAIGKENITGDIGSKDVIILTAFDYNRDYLNYLSDTYACDIYYAYDIVNMQKVKLLPEDLFIFGAGKYAEIVNRFLNRFGKNVKGFVVSSGNKTAEWYQEKKVYELHEVGNDSCFVVGVQKYEEIYDVLDKNGYKNYINGIDLISTWMFSVESVI